MTKIKIRNYFQFGIVFLLLLFLFVGGPQLYDIRSVKKLWDLGHIVLFAFLFIIILRQSKWLKKQKLYLQFTIVIMITIVFGLIIEWIQLYIGRTSELIDVWRNVVGSLIAFVYSKQINSINKYKIYLARIIVMILVAFASLPFVKVLIDEIQARHDFPVVADFENPFEIEKWYGNSYISISNESVYHGNYSLKVKLISTKYSGISINYFPTNWEKFSLLKFNIYSEYENPIELTCRIHDINHDNQFPDRMNKTIVVNKGWNGIEIPFDEIIHAPVDRNINIKEIKNFALFASNLEEEIIIYFDYMRLE